MLIEGVILMTSTAS